MKVGTFDGRRGPLGNLLDRDRAAIRRAVRVERLSLGDPEQPPAQVGLVAEPGICPKRRQHRLLPAVLGVDRAHAGRQIAVNVGPVLVEERLERWQPHVKETPQEAQA